MRALKGKHGKTALQEAVQKVGQLANACHVGLSKIDGILATGSDHAASRLVSKDSGA